MIDFFVENTELGAAIISGFVSMVVSVFAGIITLIKARQKIHELRTEIIVKKFSEHAAAKFLEAHSEFKQRYKTFESELKATFSDQDGTKRVQKIIDFYQEHSRKLIDRYPDFLGEKIVRAGQRMQSALDDLSKYFVPNDDERLHYAKEVQDAGFEVNKMIYNFRPR